MRELMGKKSGDFASYWAKQEKSVEKALAKTVEMIEALEEN